MKLTTKDLTRLGALALIAGVIGLGGCKSSSTRTPGVKFSDDRVASKVHKELASDPTFKYSDVRANVYDGSVQLSGFVETPEQRFRAGETAANVRGVKQVINEIMIKPMPTGRATIRDPLGRETGRLLLDTNAPPPRMHNLPESHDSSQHQQQQQGAPNQ
jgi:hyperosmotically inducible periplasmic protein